MEFTLDINRVTTAGIALVLIYSVQFLAARFSLSDQITVAGLTVIRFITAGMLFVPYFLFRSGLSKARTLGIFRITILTVLAGFPYLLVINTGISLTSAGYVATVGPGSIVLFSFLLPFLALKGKPDNIALISTTLITMGILLFVYNTFIVEGISLVGTSLFVLQGFMFSLYGVLIKRWDVDPVLGTAVVSLTSCIPATFFAWTADLGLSQASIAEIISQVIVQGVLAGAAAIFLYTYIVQKVGPQRASLLMPSVPLITTISGYLFLSETITAIQAIGLVVMAVGMAVPGTVAILRFRTNTLTPVSSSIGENDL